MEINNELDKLSKKMHSKTGYSIISSVTEMKDDEDFDSTLSDYFDNLYRFSSQQWIWFIDFLNEACK